MLMPGMMVKLCLTGDRDAGDRDADGLGDEQHKYNGRVGKIVRRNTYHETGESRWDPLFSVKFSDGNIDGFWTEELKKV